MAEAAVTAGAGEEGPDGIGERTAHAAVKAVGHADLRDLLLVDLAGLAYGGGEINLVGVGVGETLAVGVVLLFPVIADGRIGAGILHPAHPDGHLDLGGGDGEFGLAGVLRAVENLGIEQGGLDNLVQKSYSLLGLISFLTSGKDECRAWTIRKGTKAPQAAGKIHSDIERGFIRAEVIAFEDLIAIGSLTAAKEKGMVRSEGKEYVMQDGDVVLFRFNV